MPGRRVWAVSGRGNVYTLSVKSSNWAQVNNQGAKCLQGFKKISTVSTCVWGLGCDHQVYVYVTSDLPIRAQQATYENERWIPSRGWSGQNLLSVDPWMWSSDDCLRCLPKEDFKVPTEHWEWESDWYVDENVNGHLTDKGGWRFASLDFFHDFTHEKRFKSCVRRRRWIRYCRYISNKKWARVASIHVDPLEEPIVDIASGGQELPYQSPGFHLLYAITINGRLLYRSGLSTKSPEGKSWEELSLGGDDGVLSVSVGPRGALWVVTWNGSALARTGVSQQCVTGKSWISIEAPDPDDRLTQIAVGINAVWATTNSGKVWFRKGVKTTGTDDQCVEGTGWIGMMHRMRMVAMAPNDQVWGIGYDDRQVFFRTDVTSEEQTGRNWVLIDLPYNTVSNGMRGRHDSEASAVSDASSPGAITNMSDYNLASPLSGIEDKGTEEELPSPVSLTDASSLCPVVADTLDEQTNAKIDNGCADIPNDTELNPERLDNQKDSLHFQNNHHFQKGKNAVKSLLKTAIKKVPIVKQRRSNLTKVSFSMSTGAINLDSSPTKSEPVGSLVHSESASSDLSQVDLSPRTWLVDLAAEAEEDDSFQDDLWMQEISDEGEIQWIWVCPGGCYIPLENEIKHWLNPEYMKSSKNILKYQEQLSNETWRSAIFQLIKSRNKKQLEPFRQYEHAIETACWIKKGSLRWWRDLHRGHKWVDCTVELSQDVDQGRDGCFTIQYNYQNQPKYYQLPLHEILCCCAVQDFTCQFPSVAIHIQPRLLSTPRLPPITMASRSEEELEDWMASLSVACSDMRYVHGRAQHSALWMTSDRGDVFVHDADQYQLNELPSEMHWRQFGGHLKMVETNVVSVTWGLGHNGTPWVYTGGYGGGFFKGVASSPNGIHAQVDHREIYIYENQRWRPVIGYTERVLISDRIAWTDESGRFEATKESYKLPSKHWQWVSDWQVDQTTMGGVDKEGWQYAKDFRGPFRGVKRLQSYVRRRRWVRRCQVSTTGPWSVVEELRLKDVSVQIDPPEGGSSPVAVWAISQDGSVLCREGVTCHFPMGHAWTHVPTDQTFVSISVGGSNNVWATAIDGSAWLRGGIRSPHPSGQYWHQIPPPLKGVKLQQVSAGMNEVYAVDQTKNLWMREGLSNACPEGQCWRVISQNVRQVSVGPKDQVWAILDAVLMKGGSCHGVMGRWVHPSADANAGHWEYGIGGELTYVTARSWLK